MIKKIKGLRCEVSKAAQANVCVGALCISRRGNEEVCMYSERLLTSIRLKGYMY